MICWRKVCSSAVPAAKSDATCCKSSRRALSSCSSSSSANASKAVGAGDACMRDVFICKASHVNHVITTAANRGPSCPHPPAADSLDATPQSLAPHGTAFDGTPHASETAPLPADSCPAEAWTAVLAILHQQREIIHMSAQHIVAHNAAHSPACGEGAAGEATLILALPVPLLDCRFSALISDSISSRSSSHLSHRGAGRGVV